MSKYSIHDLEVLSGIKSNTIRMWERRYNIFNPDRTDSNIRQYSSEDLQKILNIAILKNRGVKISKIAKYSIPQLAGLVQEYTIKQDKYIDDTIEQLSVSMVSMNEEGFNNTLNRSIAKIGYENTFYEKVFPFFERVGYMWQTNAITPVQEHFVSNLIRQKLFRAIDEIPLPSGKDTPTSLFFLIEGEMHELSLLFYAYLMKKSGHKIINLGQSIPLDDVVRVVTDIPCNYLFTAFISPVSLKKIRETIHLFSSTFQEKKLFLTGYQLSKINFKIPENVYIISSPQKLKALIRKNVL